MLRLLRIEHLAVIDALQVELEPGLNVITGETGAGKSMLVQAVGLLMGGRASADLVRTGETLAIVQAQLESADGDLILRREVSAQGRSRAFVDDGLVTATGLRDAVTPLVELHGQHEHQTLLDPQSHLALLDSVARLEGSRAEVAAAYRVWKDAEARLDALNLDEREKAARIDLLTVQLGELTHARLRVGEDEELETSKRVLSSAERLQRLCHEAYGALYEHDDAALGRLAVVWKRLAELAEVDPAFAPHLEARDAIKSQLTDLATMLRTYADGIDASPARLQEVEDRLVLVDRLKRKYGPTLAEAIARRDALTQQLAALEGAGELRAGLAVRAAEAKRQYVARARELSSRRRAAAHDFAGRLRALLEELAMGRTAFEVRFQDDSPESVWNEQGIDVAECYLSANVGEAPRPLARIASGGELSRVMLAIRTLAATGTPGKTLIFDEIDTGIGGRVAAVVGESLRRLGERFQVLCITHLPQIAAAGHVHFQIEKQVVQGRTRTQVRRLGTEERVEELARMIGGAQPAHAARAAARELLGESEAKSKGESEGRPRVKVRPA